MCINGRGNSYLCKCFAGYKGKNCEKRIDSLSSEEKLQYGCELRPCWIGSTCEDRPDGTFICHCAAVIFFEYSNYETLNILKTFLRIHMAIFVNCPL